MKRSFNLNKDDGKPPKSCRHLLEGENPQGLGPVTEDSTEHDVNMAERNREETPMSDNSNESRSLSSNAEGPAMEEFDDHDDGNTDGEHPEEDEEEEDEEEEEEEEDDNNEECSDHNSDKDNDGSSGAAAGAAVTISSAFPEDNSKLYAGLEDSSLQNLKKTDVKLLSSSEDPNQENIRKAEAEKEDAEAVLYLLSSELDKNSTDASGLPSSSAYDMNPLSGSEKDIDRPSGDGILENSSIPASFEGIVPPTTEKLLFTENN